MTDGHIDDRAATRYLAGRVSPAEAASIEAHVMACTPCQTTIAELSSPSVAATTDLVWASIRATIAQPRPLPLERVLRGLGLSTGVSRIVAATRGQVWAGMLGAAVLLVLAVNANASSDSAVAGYAMVVLAPLIPLGAVAAVYAPTADPMRDLVRASPIGIHGILMLRVVVVLTGSLGAMALMSLALPARMLSAVWLLPALALSLLSILLSRRMPVSHAAAVLGALWLLAATLSLARGGPLGAPSEDVLGRFVAFRPVGQGLLAVTVGLAVVLLIVLKDRFDLEGPRP